MTSIKKLAYGLLGLSLLSQGYAAENSTINNLKHKANTELDHDSQKRPRLDNLIEMDVETALSPQPNLCLLGNEIITDDGIKGLSNLTDVFYDDKDYAGFEA